MIVGIAQVALLVREHDEAMAFYCGKLGFVVAEDSRLPNGKRWVRLKAPGQGGRVLTIGMAAAG